MCRVSSKENDIGHEIKALNNLIQRRMVSSAIAHGVDSVTVMHGWIIGYLSENSDRDIFQKDIESEFAISRSTVTSILKLMEKKGYITRISVESDARLKKLSLTAEGNRVSGLIWQTIEENERYFKGLLTGEEFVTLMCLIKKLRSSMEQSDAAGRKKPQCAAGSDSVSIPK